MRFTLRPLALSVPLALLSACSAGDGPLGEAQQEQVVCPAGATVEGVDVSYYQGTIDWNAVKGAGLGFAITRISDGTGFMDPKFDQNWQGIKDAGMVRGAYQFFRPAQDAAAQANLVVQKLGTLGVGDLPVTLDVEVADGVSPGTIAAKIQTWVDIVQQGTGKAPMIYTAIGFWNSGVASTAYGNLPLWVANWGVTCPNLPSGWNDFVFWQWTDSGSVPGISGGVDRDKFNGDLAALQKFAGQAPDWGAKYVNQSWPFATMTMTMTVNQKLPASITLKNVGQKSWDENTRLGTTEPRDRMSPFVSSDWIAPNRPSGLPKGMTVPPGQDYEFKFTFQAPNTPGMYDEFYSVLEEGVHWFGDPGQAGPPDNQIEAKIEVVEADYHGEVVSQSFPTLADAPIEMKVGQVLEGYVEIKNVGNATWKAGETKLAPTPRDMASPLKAGDWLSDTRVSTLDSDVAPGATVKFPLSLKASKTGDFTQTFSLVEEGVTWFADAPKGGGPPDELIAVHVVVGKATSGGADAGADGGIDIGGEVKGSCSCRAAGDERSSAGALGIGVFGLLLFALRRRK
jgi:lysozyme